MTSIKTYHNNARGKKTKLFGRILYMLTTLEKQEIINTHRTHDKDCGSVEVQVALLTDDIKKLTEHFKVNAHDFHSRVGLTRKVNQRRKLLRYLHKKNLTGYRELIKRLGLRDSISAR